MASDNNIHTLCEAPPKFEELKSLTLKGNFLRDICDTFLHIINQSTLSYIDLSSNRLTRISQKFKGFAAINTLLLADNQFTCDCDMLWMAGWLVNFETKIWQQNSERL